ncbi:unnamed protein product [Callosobruchus maculatus]|uniref:C-type lectin domain-containing protein n=1 Tax=Callosobruchus maculatus TaxID=64391 RepID=A0A653D3W6_CALMS|nr:unnamed protein product [Callosobruchus maculatus]
MHSVANMIVPVCLLFCFGFASCDNDGVTSDQGIWGPLLEEWALTNHRQGRVMMIPLTPTMYVMDDKMDSTEKGESKISPGNKIVTSGPSSNYNNNNYNNYNKKPPGRQVSETDLYLLGAIEKLVYKVDFIEKRLRRVEEMLYYAVAGNRIDTEPCKGNFTRVGGNCYYFNSEAGREYDWKVASKQCKKMGAFLAEMETIEENQDLVTYIQSSNYLRGKDYWVGGLNPGLLWIWSNSARPVAAPGSQNNKENPSAAIQGEGRCLRLAFNPALRSYAYKGSDCSVRYGFICEEIQNTSSNEIKRIGRSKRIFSDEL